MKREAWIPLLMLATCGPVPFSLTPLDPDAYLGPTVVGTFPAPGSAGIPLDHPLALTFSTQLTPASLFRGIRVSGSQGALPFTFVTLADGRTVRLHGDWPADTQIRVHVDANVTDRKGRALRDQDSHDSEPDTPFTLAVTTGSDRLADPPRVTVFDPRDDASGVPVAVEPTVTFSKQMGAGLPVITLLGASGAIGHTAIWEASRTRVRVRPERLLAEDTLFELRVEYARDAWGLDLAVPAAGKFATRRGGGRVVINEVVTNPLQDWGETSPGDGLPFNSIPGTGSITVSDEWIELYNGAAAAVDLTGWTLDMLDGSNQTHSFGLPFTGLELFFPATSSVRHFEAGAYLVVGNPAGDNADTVTLVLRDQYGMERDRVSLGAGAPSGAGSSLADEAVARIPNGADTGDDAVDWQRTKATPGGPNN